MNKHFTFNGWKLICCLFLSVFFFSASLTAQSEIATRDIINTTRCDNGSTNNAGVIYGLYILLEGEDRLHNFQSGTLTEYDNGTATLTGEVVNNSNPDIQFHVDIDFSGRTFSAPQDSPKPHNCFNPSSSDWYYYTGLNGTLAGAGPSSGSSIEILGNAGPAFQIGTGANVTSNGTDFGGCGWLSMEVSNQSSTGPQFSITTSSVGTNGDINIDLSGSPLSPPGVCNNVTNGGTIGSNQSVCSGEAATLSGTSPTGGSGAIEYLWLSSTVDCPGQLSQAIEGATGSTYNPGVLTETTYFVRCSRRAGCDSWAFGESNCVTIEVATQTPGTTCNDGNNNTFNDVIQADGCSCAGTVTNDSCNKYQISNSTPECDDSFESLSGVFFQRDCGETFTVWQAGSDLMLTENGDGTANIAGTILNNGSVAEVFITLEGYSANGENWTNECYNASLAPQYFYTSFFGTIIEEGDIAYTIEQKASGRDFVFGTGANNQTDGSLGLGGWTTGTWGTCIEVFASLTPLNPGDTCDDSNANTSNDVILADGCSCAGSTDPVIVDNDNDGVPAGEDCDDNDASVPATVGSSCNDGDANTNNDVILADGCSCAGTPDNGNTPDCNDITISAGDGSVVISGLDGAPVTSVQIFNSAWQQEFACFADCNTPTEIIPVSAGEYLVYVKYYTASYSLICEENATITVGGGGPVIIDNDNDGFPANEDCDDNDASVPATVGSSCNDGNDNTNNDIIMADGCTCVGTPIGGGVTDNDNDGVPAEQDCNDNDASVPAAVGSSCNDGNGNTTNDIIQADGCTCAGSIDNGGGTPDCANIGITSANGNIVITGLDGAPVTSIQVFNMDWQGTFSCFADCNSPMETIPAADGEYLVYVKYYTVNYSLVCEESTTITVGDGGTGIVDNDNDGVPAIEDCDDNDPSVPATVGSSCNDGNNNTTGDVILADGCSCAGTPIATGSCNKYLITDSTPECGGGITEASGVFYQKDCGGGEITVWQAGPDLMLTENGDGTANIAGTILNNGNTASVFITLEGYSTTGDNWSLECYNDNLTPQYFYTSFSGTVVEEGDIAYTIEEKASGKDFVFGPGANNQSDNTLGIAGWAAGTWASCLEVFATLTPLNAGDTCDDSNADTDNDVIQADGCTCAGSNGGGGNEGVDLALSVTGDGNEVGAYQGFSTTFTITNEGTVGSDNIVVNIPQPQGVVFEGNNPFIASAGSYDYYSTFNWNVGTLAPGQTETITLNYYSIGAAPYTIYGQVSNASGTDADSTPGNGTAPTPNEDDEAVYTTGNGGGITDNDNDGIPAGEDCNDNDPSVPAAVGSSCNDGNANTSDDVILADGCSCEGTPNGGGLTDNDNDGVPAGEDCDDNDPSVPATVGSSCNDGNANTSDDVILADGCSCEGTPIGTDNCDDILISEEDGMISIGGLGNAPLTAVWVFDAGWNTVFNCSYGCQDLETYQAQAGTYNVVVKKLNADWSLICETSQQIVVDGGSQNDILTLTGPDNQTVVAAPGANSAIVTYPTPVASTTCADDGLELVRTAGPASGSAFPIGTTTITYTATDDCGNSETVSFTITVSPQDADLTLTGPDNQTVNAAPGANSAVVTYPTPVANTTCADGGLELVRTAGPASGAAFPIGTTTITYQATDACGNSETVSFTITVSGSDSVISISCPANITADTAPGATSAIVTYGDATANTNCADNGLNIAVTQGPASGASFPVGTTTVKYTATDACGGMEMCTFTVTVNAVAAPDCEITRTATNATQCVNGTDYGVWVQGDYYTVSNTSLTEYSDGTAILAGTANGLGAIHIEFTGRTNSLTPLFGNCFTPSTNDWYYYTNFTGTIGSLNVESNQAHPFQIGKGANNQNQNAFGGSGWWNATNGQSGDINLLLSGNAGTLEFDDSCEEPVAGCDLDVLFVVGNTTLSAGDTAIKNRLTSQGYNVMTVDAQWAETSDANGKDLILISSTVLSTDLGTTFKHVEVPVITWESYLFDDMAMTGNSAGTSFGTQWGVQAYTATNHPINGNLSGTFNVFTSEDDVSWGYPYAAANDAGYIPGSPNNCMIIAYDEDDSMYGNFHAPARRVGFFLRDNNATKLTAKGWLLFDQSIQWLTNCTPSQNLVRIQDGEAEQEAEERTEEEVTTTLAFGIYPNPATDMVNVSLVEMNGAAVIINVYDALGRNIDRVEADAAYNSVYRINTSDYKSGMYMISVQTGDAPAITKQLVIMGH